MQESHLAGNFLPINKHPQLVALYPAKMIEISNQPKPTNQHHQQIYILQAGVVNLERYITDIQLRNKFTWFSRDGLYQYRAGIYDLRLRQSQLRWQVHQLMFSRY